MGYNSEEVFHQKQNYIKLLKNNFNENNDFKSLFSKEFKQILYRSEVHIENDTEIKEHNKIKHLILNPKCFKKSLMLLQTERSKQIRQYYIDVEEIFKDYLKYQNKYKENLLEDKNKQINILEDNNKIKTDSLIQSYIGKPVIYLADIGDNCFKFGISNKIDNRVNQHLKTFKRFEIIYIQECYNNLFIENRLKKYCRKNNKLITKEINEKNFTEIIQIDEVFTIDKIIQKIKDYCLDDYLSLIHI
jgi:hypothetical protein